MTTGLQIAWLSRMAEITVYGTHWCPMTRRALDHLRTRGVPFKYVDIDQDSDGRKWVEEQNAGKAKTPTLNINGEILTEPSDAELDRAIGRG
jgi:glutaredoxin